MNKEQNDKKNAKKLPGFYIALCCCVLALGVAGYITERRTSKVSSVLNHETVQDNSQSENDFSVAIATIPPDVPQRPVVTAKPTVEETPVIASPITEEPVDEYAVDNPDVQENAITVTSEQPAFIMPVIGDVLEGYSDKLIYNNALSDWRTHNGIDIAAEKGCSVQSVANGVVDEISEDVMGKYVVISHATGFVTKYMGLENTENLTVGKEIKSGEVIGTIGDCKGENTTAPHLHFEMIKDGNAVNPSDYLPH